MKKPMKKMTPKEGSAKDNREDMSMAKKKGHKMGKFEKSSADSLHDMMGMSHGGKVRGYKKG